jgi:site-specific recombinase XerD
MSKYDIYRHEKNLIAAENRIKKANYSKEDKELILKYEEFLFAEGLSTARVLKYLGQLNRIASYWGMSLKDATKDDVVSLIGKIERHNYKPNTKNDYKKCIKKFYRWHYGKKKPKITKWIKIKPVKDSSVQKEDLLLQEEILSLIKAAEHPRDKALFSILADSGARIGEIANIKIKNIFFDDKGALLSVDGKTGKRTIRIVASVPDLSRWLDMHPLKDNVNAPLWINIGTRNRGKHMNYDGFRKVVMRTVEKAGVNKRVYHHLFRHTRSTELSSHFTDAIMNAHFGWVPGSNMPRTYVHLNGKDTDQAMLALHGLVEDKTKTLLTFKQCYHCDTKNSPASNLCSHCGRPLDLKATMDFVDIRKQLNIEITNLISIEPNVNCILQENLCVGQL